ncbi:MAG: signal peptidase I [Pseudomonadota bacterium]
MTEESQKQSGWLVFVRDVAIMALLIFAARSAFADWYRVPTGSMKPTILEGDRVFVNRVAYDLKIPFTRVHLMKWGDPERGQVVVLHSPKDGTRLIKRVIGVPGDEIQIRDQMLFINGSPISVEPLAPSELDAVNDMMPSDLVNHSFGLEALPGQSHAVMHRNGLAFRNAYDIEVPQDHYYVMGDNRDSSADSRVFGLVHRDLVVGHAKSIIMSFDQEQFLSPRWDRFFESLR